MDRKPNRAVAWERKRAREGKQEKASSVICTQVHKHAYTLRGALLTRGIIHTDPSRTSGLGLEAEHEGEEECLEAALATVQVAQALSDILQWGLAPHAQAHAHAHTPHMPADSRTVQRSRASLKRASELEHMALVASAYLRTSHVNRNEDIKRDPLLFNLSPEALHGRPPLRVAYRAVGGGPGDPRVEEKGLGGGPL